MLRIQSLILAVIILLASNTYAVTSHFCMGNLVSVSFLKDSGCFMEMDNNDDDCKSVEKIENEGCCSDSVDFLEPDVSDYPKDYSFSTNLLFDLSVEKIELNPNYLNNDVYVKPPLEYRLRYFKSNYLQILFQSFLI